MPDLIRDAWDELREVFERELLPQGIGRDWPGFDLLSLDADGRLDRMIELKSSKVSARTQECTWNEWKSVKEALTIRCPICDLVSAEICFCVCMKLRTIQLITKIVSIVWPC